MSIILNVVSFFNSLDSDVIYTAVDGIGEIVRGGPLPLPDTLSASHNESYDIKGSLSKEIVFKKVVQRMKDTTNDNTVVSYYIILFSCPSPPLVT